MFRSIVSAFVCTLPFEKSTEKANVYRKAFISKMAGVHSSLEGSVIIMASVTRTFSSFFLTQKSAKGVFLDSKVCKGCHFEAIKGLKLL